MSERLCRLKNGRFVKKKNYERYEKGLKKNITCKIQQSVNDSSINKNEFELLGRRIIDLKMLKKMYCTKCNTKLHFDDATGESRFGLHSTFSIKCEKCRSINKVNCGEKNDDGIHANNTTMVMGKKIIIVIMKVFLNLMLV